MTTRTLRLLPIPRSLEQLGGSLRIETPETLDPTLQVDPDSELPSEGYELRITESGVHIEAPDQNGLAYGAGAFGQIQGQCGQELPALRIRDWPDFPVRAYMLDISRDRVPSQAMLLELVDILAALRINQLQLYTEHTFAYSAHERVWRNASPLTPDEVRELDTRCAERGIELVPNQNSFGHMERWLQHPEYRHLAELPDGRLSGDGSRQPPSCLAPTEESVAFMHALYAELLPCFRSRMLNIGCDETFELGLGRSRAECEARGRGRVYLDYLLRLCAGLHAEGRTVQLWGDMLSQHPELIAALLREGLVALVWGYEAPQDPEALPTEVRSALTHFGVSPESLRGFSWRIRPFADAGFPFYVCPGTSSWNSLIGRLPNARANLLDAARTGLAQGARGYLITDWGDNGHLQPWSVSLPPLAYGAAVSWCVQTNADLALEPELGLLLPGDPDGVIASALIRLGSVYQELGLKAMNASPLALALLAPPGGRLAAWGETNEQELTSVIQTLEQERERLAHAAPADRDAELVCRELRQAAALARHGAWRLGHILLGQGPSKDVLRRDLAACIEEQTRVWEARSRPGGLEDSLARLRRTLASDDDREPVTV
jgi:hypothetical protein